MAGTDRMDIPGLSIGRGPRGARPPAAGSTQCCRCLGFFLARHFWIPDLSFCARHKRPEALVRGERWHRDYRLGSCPLRQYAQRRSRWQRLPVRGSLLCLRASSSIGDERWRMRASGRNEARRKWLPSSQIESRGYLPSWFATRSGVGWDSRHEFDPPNVVSHVWMVQCAEAPRKSSRTIVCLKFRISTL